MNRSTIRAVQCALAVLLVASGCATRAERIRARPTDPQLSAQIPASALRSVTVQVVDGTLAVSPSSDDNVHVAVRVSGGGCLREPDVVSLRTRQAGEDLRLDIRPSTKGRCDEHWRIALPARFEVNARGNRADMTVQGINGGVDLFAGKGTIEVAATTGDIEAVVANGDVRVDAEWSADYGEIRLAAQVGRVEMSMNGRRVRHPRPAGPGDWLELGGPGDHRVSLRATVGNVRLDMGEAR
jgi:hypothetical protein